MQLDVVVSPPASEFDYCKHVVFIHMWGYPLGSHNRPNDSRDMSICPKKHNWETF